MEANTLTPGRLESAGIGAFFRPRDLEALEIPFAELQRLVADGVVEKVGLGLYRLVAAEASEFETLAMVASAVPGGIVCLLSALALHGIGTQAPYEVGLPSTERRASRPDFQRACGSSAFPALRSVTGSRPAQFLASQCA